MSFVNGTGEAEERVTHKLTCSEGDLISIGVNIRVRVLEVEQDVVVLRIENSDVALDDCVDAGNLSQYRTIRVSTAANQTRLEKRSQSLPPASRPK